MTTVLTTRLVPSSAICADCRNSRCIIAYGTTDRPLRISVSDMTRMTGTAAGLPIASASGPASSDIPPASSTPVASDIVVTVGPRPCSPCRMMSAAMPRSARAITIAWIVRATAKTPNSSGASSRASRMPVARLPTRIATLFRVLQASARFTVDASAITTACL